MPTRIPDAVQNAAVDAIVDRADAGAGAAEIRIYTGAQPADADNAATGTLLVTLTCADPAWGAAAAGSAALAATASGTAVATGTAGWFRVVDSNGSTVFDGDVTATSGGGDLELDNTSISSGQNVDVTALSVSIPASE